MTGNILHNPKSIFRIEKSVTTVGKALVDHPQSISVFTREGLRTISTNGLDVSMINSLTGRVQSGGSRSLRVFNLSIQNHTRNMLNGALKIMGRAAL
jgi:hypothetical protein